MCNHAHTFVVCPTWSGSQLPEDFLMAPINRDNIPYEDERLCRFNSCFNNLSHLNDRRWCDVFNLEYVDAVAQVMLYYSGDIVIPLLHMLGVSPQAHEAVTTLYTNSEWRNMPDNSFKSACIELYKFFPVDFHVIHYLLIRICHHDQFKIMTLDERSAIAQVKALRRRHCLMTQQPLPPSVDRLYFCNGEWRVYGDIVEPLTEELVQKAVDDCGGDALAVTNAPFGIGPKGALYSHVTKKLHCTRPPSSSIAKKLERDGFLAEGEFFGESEKKATKEDKKTAKSIRVAQRSQRDCSKPLKYVSMVGKLVRIGSRLYTLCTICASPFVVSSNNMYSDGLTCGRHVQILALGDGTSRAIEDFLDNDFMKANSIIAVPAVLVAGEKPRLTHTDVVHAMESGQKQCVRLTLEDGRTLDLTPDHRLMTAEGVWMEAKDIVVGSTRLAVSGIDYVADIPALDEVGFVLCAGDYTLKMDTPSNRRQTLAFCRMLGIVLSDGWLSGTRNASCVCIGNRIGCVMFFGDTNLFDGSTVLYSAEKNVWNVQLRAKLAGAFRSLDGIQTGIRVQSTPTLPQFFMQNTTPVSAVREFLGGFFRGDGTTMSRNKRIGRPNDALKDC